MNINEKLDCCNRIYLDRAKEEARELIAGLTKFLSNPSDNNTAGIEFAYRAFIRSKNIADAWAAHRE